MAFQSVPNTFEIDINWQVNTQNCQNTFYMQVDPLDYTATMVQDIVDDFAYIALTYWKTLLCSAVTITSVYGRGLANIVDVQGLATGSMPAAGTFSTSNPCSNNNAFAVSRKSSLTGRSSRGRVYLPLCVGALDTNEDYVNSTYTAAVNACMSNLRGRIIASGFGTEVIVSRYSGGVKRAVGITYPVEDYYITDLRVDSRRDRLP